MWRRVILDVLHHFGGAFTWTQLWEETPGREVVAIHKKAQQQSLEDQQLLAFQTFILARNPYVGGYKNIDIDDLYTGLARYKVEEPPFPTPAMRGIALAMRLDAGWFGQAHLDLLDAKRTVKWLKRHGLLKGDPGRQGRRATARQSRRAGTQRETS